MVAPAAGTVVLVRFPFSDLSRTTLRPAVVLADVERGGHILCQVTSKPYGDPAAVTLEQKAFSSGSLRVTSYARPGKLFTAHTDLMTGEAGMLKSAVVHRFVDAVVDLLRAGTASAAVREHGGTHFE